jgi:asparagine synthase (glutamine-hydrolysing)
MCGICGIVEKDQDRGRLIREMCDLLAHRGPDHAATCHTGNAWLGHRRLSIIDLNTGDQPIFNHDRSLTIIFNGEIYNYQEIREELLQKGIQFQTQSDTEVILILYQEGGVDAFSRLNGIFAFAILDRRNGGEKLILARDHFGIKPLHYYHEDGIFVFASEQKAILLHPKVHRELNEQALHYHLNLRYSPTNDTLFKDIHRVPPAHYLILENGRTTINPFFTLEPRIDYQKNEAQWLEEFPHVLKRAVSRQLVSDVPIGVTLSGGMDSSSIVAFMRQAGVNVINTFTLGFNEPTDELDDARIVADHFQTCHHAVSVDMNPMRWMPEVIWHAEEPKINLLQGFLLSDFVSNHVKVVLGGLGGDELFSGYDIHRFIYPLNTFHRIVPDWIEREVASKISRFVHYIQYKTGVLKWDEYRRGLQMLLATGNIIKFYLILRNVWDYDYRQLEAIYTPRFLNRILHTTAAAFEPVFKQSLSGTPLDRVYYAEFYTKMINDYLLTEDRMSMSHSVEERVPFLDLDLVNFGFSIPAQKKMSGLQTKTLFRKAMQAYLPFRILRKKKWGFTFNPYLQYQKDLKDIAQRILTEEVIEKEGIFNYNYIKSIFDAPPHPRMRWHYNFIWILTGYMIWKQMFLEGRGFREREFKLNEYVYS